MVDDVDGTDRPARRGRPGYDAETVLRAAIDLFNEKGYDATSVGDLAAHLGLTKSAIYHHVPSRESLLQAALDEALDALSEAIERVAAETPAGRDRLRAAVEDSVRVLVDHLPAVTLLLRVRGNGEVERAALARRRALDDRLAGMVAEAAAAGDLRDDVPPELISRLLFGLVNSLVEWYRPGGTVDRDVLARVVSSIAFDGLARR